MTIISLPPTPLSQTQSSLQDLGPHPQADDRSETITLPTCLLSSVILRQLCKKLGLSQTGNKLLCIDRIQAKLSHAQLSEQSLGFSTDLNSPGRAIATIPNENTHQLTKKRRRETRLEIPQTLTPTASINNRPPLSQLVITAEDLDKLVLLTQSLQSNADLITVFDLHQIRHTFSLRPPSNNLKQLTDRPLSRVEEFNDCGYKTRLAQLDIRSVQVCDPQALLKPGSSAHKLRFRAIRLRTASRRRHSKSLSGSLIPSDPQAEKLSPAWWYLLSAAPKAPSADSAAIETRLIPVDSDARPRNGNTLSCFLSEPAQITDPETITMLDTVMGDLF